ncbi:MAG TPA: T9SS type A sorting domain-containing protein [Bacteroidia bacterium]|nr:T9SS type A sorting domain-containing protein [Bacteroidia bacterium]
MKKTITLFACLIFITQSLLAAKHTITISGFAYSPISVNAVVGDTISIAASTTHPLVQVDQTNWNANTPTAMAGGWGTKTITYTFTVSTPGTIYYGCVNHMASMQMKGQINVTTASVKQIAATTNKATLYPNPTTNGEFTVKLDNNSTNGKVTLYNLEGKLLETYILTAGIAEIKTKLPTGAYFYSVTVNQKEILRDKFLITDK